MKITILWSLAFIFFLLAGCGPKIYDNANPNADWDRDSFMCRSYAEGNTPMPQMVPVPQTETVTGTGTIYYNNGQSTPFTYTQTYQPNQYQQLGASMQNAAASWGRIAMLQERYEKCLSHLGWYEAKNDTDKVDLKILKNKYNEIIKIEIRKNTIIIFVESNFAQKDEEYKKNMIYDILSHCEINKETFISNNYKKEFSGKILDIKNFSLLAYFSKKHGMIIY